MNPKFHLPLSILIPSLPSENLQMIHNRTPPPAILLRKPHRRTRPQIPLRIDALQPDRLIPHPISLALTKIPAALANHRPIIPRIPLSLPAPESRHLVLIAQRTLNPMSVQIPPRPDVHEANDVAASDGGAGVADGGVVSLADLPEAVGGAVVFDGGDELLAGAGLELAVVGEEVVFGAGFDVG